MIVLPFPPSVNRYWRNVRGRTLISEAGRLYRVLAVQEALVARPVRFQGHIRVSIDAWVPDARRRDCDNMLKAPLDALAHAGVYDDDSQIIDLRIRRVGVDRARPRLEVTIEACNESAQ